MNQMSKISIIFFSLSLAFLGGIFIQKYSLDKSLSKKDSAKGFIFKDESFYFQFLRTVGKAPFQCSDVAECLMTASKIEEGDFECWYEQWYKLAARLNEIADDVLKKGHKESAKECYLRASEYYRAAEFYLHGNKNDQRIYEVWRKSHDCFLKFSQFSSNIIEPIKIPYEGTHLPGYFYKIDDSKKPRPIIIMQQGFDGTLEELYGYAMAAIKRGYNVLTFAGPGQAGVLHESGLPFRPDWEKVIKPVVDYAISRPEVNSKNLVLYGLSFGGYLAPRAAAYDNRIKVLIANGGIYDFIGNFASAFEMPFKSHDEFIAWVKNNPEAFNKIMSSAMKKNISARWFFEQAKFVLHANSPSDVIIKLAEYSMKDHAEKIRCITLVVDSENESPLLAGQAAKLYENLKCPKKFMLFKTEEAAGLHCQSGAKMLSNQRIFDWLDETLAGQALN